MSEIITIHFVNEKDISLFEFNVEREHTLLKTDYFKSKFDFNNQQNINNNDKISIIVPFVLSKLQDWYLVVGFLLEPSYLLLHGFDSKVIEFCIKICEFILYEEGIQQLVEYRRILFNDPLLEEKKLPEEGHKLQQLKKIYECFSLLVFNNDKNVEPTSINGRQLLLYAKTILNEEEYSSFALYLYTIDKNRYKNNELYVVKYIKKDLKLPYIRQIYHYYDFTSMNPICFLTGRCLFKLLFDQVNEDFVYEFLVNDSSNLDKIVKNISEEYYYVQRTESTATIYTKIINDTKFKPYIRFIIPLHSNTKDSISVLRLNYNYPHYFAHITAIDAIAKKDGNLYSNGDKTTIDYCNQLLHENYSIKKMNLFSETFCQFVAKLDDINFAINKTYIIAINDDNDDFKKDILIIKNIPYNNLSSYKGKNFDYLGQLSILSEIPRKIINQCNLQFKIDSCSFFKDSMSRVSTKENLNDFDCVNVYLKRTFSISDDTIFYAIKE